jgi:hypothetical protein
MGLREIDWDRLGEAEIGAQIRNMMSTDPKIEGQALGFFLKELTPWEAIEPYYHDCNYVLKIAKRDAAYLIIPFLIEYIKRESSRGKVITLGILYNLAFYHELEPECIQDKVSEETLNEFRFYTSRLFNLVYLGIDVYRSFLNHQDEDIRGQTLQLLKTLHEQI